MKGPEGQLKCHDPVPGWLKGQSTIEGFEYVEREVRAVCEREDCDLGGGWSDSPGKR